MGVPKYKQTKSELETVLNTASELRSLLRKQCPHNDIKEEWYVNDDWAQNKKYTVSYKCQFCGTYASFDEEDDEPKSDTFLLLEKKYRAHKEREWKSKRARE